MLCWICTFIFFFLFIYSLIYFIWNFDLRKSYTDKLFGGSYTEFNIYLVLLQKKEYDVGFSLWNDAYIYLLKFCYWDYCWTRFSFFFLHVRNVNIYSLPNLRELYVLCETVNIFFAFHVGLYVFNFFFFFLLGCILLKFEVEELL